MPSRRKAQRNNVRADGCGECGRPVVTRIPVAGNDWRCHACASKYWNAVVATGSALASLRRDRDEEYGAAALIEACHTSHGRACGRCPYGVVDTRHSLIETLCPVCRARTREEAKRRRVRRLRVLARAS